MIHLFMIFWWLESSKEPHLFEIVTFYNIINVFTIRFDQFIASLLNKLSYLKKETPNFSIVIL